MQPPYPNIQKISVCFIRNHIGHLALGKLIGLVPSVYAFQCLTGKSDNNNTVNYKCSLGLK